MKLEHGIKGILKLEQSIKKGKKKKKGEEKDIKFAEKSKIRYFKKELEPSSVRNAPKDDISEEKLFDMSKSHKKPKRIKKKLGYKYSYDLTKKLEVYSSRNDLGLSKYKRAEIIMKTFSESQVEEIMELYIKSGNSNQDALDMLAEYKEQEIRNILKKLNSKKVKKLNLEKILKSKDKVFWKFISKFETGRVILSDILKNGPKLDDPKPDEYSDFRGQINKILKRAKKVEDFKKKLNSNDAEISKDIEKIIISHKNGHNKKDFFKELLKREELVENVLKHEKLVEDVLKTISDDIKKIKNLHFDENFVNFVLNFKSGKIIVDLMIKRLIKKIEKIDRSNHEQYIELFNSINTILKVKYNKLQYEYYDPNPKDPNDRQVFSFKHNFIKVLEQCFKQEEKGELPYVLNIESRDIENALIALLQEKSRIIESEYRAIHEKYVSYHRRIAKLKKRNKYEEFESYKNDKKDTESRSVKKAFAAYEELEEVIKSHGKDVYNNYEQKYNEINCIWEIYEKGRKKLKKFRKYNSEKNGCEYSEENSLINFITDTYYGVHCLFVNDTDKIVYETVEEESVEEESVDAVNPLKLVKRKSSEINHVLYKEKIVPSDTENINRKVVAQTSSTIINNTKNSTTVNNVVIQKLECLSDKIFANIKNLLEKPSAEPFARKAVAYILTNHQEMFACDSKTLRNEFKEHLEQHCGKSEDASLLISMDLAVEIVGEIVVI